MTVAAVYPRAWAASTAIAVAALSVVGLVATRPEHLLALGAVVAAASLGGVVWAATSSSAPPGSTTATTRRSQLDRGALPRRAAALPAVTVLAAVGAGHLGPPALLVVVLLLVTCPWLLCVLRPPGRGPGASL